MGKVMSAFTVSLDGFIAGPGDDVGRLFRWYDSGDTAFPVRGTDRVFKISRASADLLREQWDGLGALVTGRRDFDVSEAWGGKAFLGLPTFVVTHHPPQEWLKEGSPFTFVTDGVASAVEKAKKAAGDKDVAVGGSTVIRQCLQAGLLDELHIDLAPILLGDGIRLFDRLGAGPIELESTSVLAGAGVTHLTFRVIKEKRV